MSVTEVISVSVRGWPFIDGNGMVFVILGISSIWNTLNPEPVPATSLVILPGSSLTGATNDSFKVPKIVEKRVNIASSAYM